MLERITKEEKNGVPYSVYKLKPGELLGEIKEGDERTIQDLGQSNTTFERKALLDDGWRMAGLPSKQLTEQIFKKGDETIIWDVKTKMIVERSIKE